jgi:pimeloyl-ACP methyl ester carboxylesterase
VCAWSGLSQGGFVAEHLCATRPELVQAAVLFASAGATTAYQRALFADDAVPREFFVAENLANTLPAMVLRDDDEAVGRWVEMLSAQDWATPGQRGQYLACISWMLDVDRAARRPRMECPVLVLSCEHDLMFPPRTGREAAAAMPNASFVEITGHAHGGAIQAGDQVNPVVLDFFARH